MKQVHCDSLLNCCFLETGDWPRGETEGYHRSPQVYLAVFALSVDCVGKYSHYNISSSDYCCVDIICWLPLRSVDSFKTTMSVVERDFRPWSFSTGDTVGFLHKKREVFGLDTMS